MVTWIKDKIKKRDALHGAGIIVACLLIIAFGSMADKKINQVAYCIPSDQTASKKNM